MEIINKATPSSNIVKSNSKLINTKRKTKEKLIYIFLGLATAITLGFLFWLVGYIIINGILHIDLIYLMPAIVTTIYMVLIGLGIAVPIGVGAAIYLQEYATGGRFVKIIRFATECLTAVPSILFGLFGMLFFVTTLKMSWSLLAGGLTVSIMILPTVVKTTEEALKTVPISYREASLALGANKIMTILKVVLPSSIPGILAGIVLSMGRIIGETAAIYLTAGTVFGFPDSIMNSGRTLSVHLYILAKEGVSLSEAYGAAVVLLIIILSLNCLSYFIAAKMKKLK